MTKTIGVIGGMGPAATVDFFAKLLEATPAERDQDHLRVLIDCNPRVPDRNAAIAGRGPSPGPQLADAARGLERAGADVLVIACNTAHAFAADIQAAVDIPLLSMIEATADAALAGNRSRVGVLAADGCRRAGLYQRAFAERDVEALFLNDAAQQDFMQLIYRIKAGDIGDASRRAMERLAISLNARGAQAVIAACTEAPLVLNADTLATPVISSTDALVARVVAFARAG
ncbi:MAG: amino acid racemase [Proteobacteria bacterium]|nr:amino acid racemase [Pseudomonadota bacterium]